MFSRTWLVFLSLMLTGYTYPAVHSQFIVVRGHSSCVPTGFHVDGGDVDRPRIQSGILDRIVDWIMLVTPWQPIQRRH